IEKIAIANSEIAPYGIAALEALNNDSLYDQLRTKFIVGESIGQVNQYIQLKAVDIGITSKSVLYSPHVTEKGKSIEIDQKLYAPIDQGIVILKHGKENNLIHAELFYDFMFSDEVRSILFNFGYNVN
ncbi:molybdate ABC transporter substrate-binding protein, partial [Reichenbachiella sp.]